jgi:hypothetical protein
LGYSSRLRSFGGELQDAVAHLLPGIHGIANYPLLIRCAFNEEFDESLINGFTKWGDLDPVNFFNFIVLGL